MLLCSSNHFPKFQNLEYPVDSDSRTALILTSKLFKTGHLICIEAFEASHWAHGQHFGSPGCLAVAGNSEGPLDLVVTAELAEDFAPDWLFPRFQTTAI